MSYPSPHRRAVPIRHHSADVVPQLAGRGVLSRWPPGAQGLPCFFGLLAAGEVADDAGELTR